jgi:hypothetical protein
MPTQLTCSFYDCTSPATALIVNTEHDTFPFKTGAAIVCEPHAEETLRADKWGCARVEGWPEDESACICPPELLARDGFRGACPVHGAR